jgi:hypothetical protein
MRVVAHEGDSAIPVEITELNQQQIEVLIPPESPEPEPGTEEGGDGHEPTPPTDGQPPATPDEPREPSPASATEPPEPE